MGTSNDELVVLLTGANRGIGYHVAAGLLDAGHRVAAIDVEGDNVEGLRDEQPDRVRFHECDVSDTDDVETAVSDVIEEWGRVDVLVNNAAIATEAPFEDRTVDGIRREFEVNVLGYVRTIRAVLPHMRSRDAGIVHNVGSPTGDVGHPGLSGYAATKGAIRGLTRSLRLELRNTGVSCTLMVPPTTDTRMTVGLGFPAWLLEDPEDVGRKLAGKIESTATVITPDLKTAIGRHFVRVFPDVWARVTERFADLDG